ncbi:hypothetical protein J2X19_005181 [Rhodoferax ferrireducens]|uniref:Conjugal transfer protein TraX n=1 Tax=Rhodoferax ferrireducens TaxID=192843 RepID=A0ABU2CGK2_9BURK|nr:TraX family protein [Rhodoferax ferrireducens]MDR7380472.1 hypothetical protein [Rhodoferax ferrireducens]
MARSRSNTADLPAPGAARLLAPLDFSEASLSAMKWLALVLMVVDHSNKYLFEGAVAWMFALGRISMPLFAVVLGINLARPGMLANGGYRRLAQRLAAFGLLATVPFIAINKLPSGWWPLNMMFTMLVAVVSVWLFDMRRQGATIAACLVLAWGGALGEYWWPAIGLSLCVWAYQRQPSRALIASFMTCLTLLWFVNGNLWALAVLPVLFALRWWPVMLPRAQWVFYAFYPLHLAVFWLVLTVKS